MRLLRASVDGRVTAMLVGVDGRARPLADPPPGEDPLLELLRAGLDPQAPPAVEDGAASYDVDDLELLSPLARPGKIVAIGLNYHDHAAETGLRPPAEPLTFAKYPSSLTGPRADIVVDPAVTGQVDYEVELAAVIGRTCAPGTATVADVAAYCVGNDVSARDVQFGDRQWTRGKSFDTFTPLGPWLVTADEVPDVQALRLWTEVDGERRQDDTTASMVFGVAALLAHVSRATTLEPGDVVLTGTPSGVGAFLDPPRYLADGQVVRMGVDGIGELSNRVVVRG